MFQEKIVIQIHGSYKQKFLNFSGTNLKMDGSNYIRVENPKIMARPDDNQQTLLKDIGLEKNFNFSSFTLMYQQGQSNNFTTLIT